MSEIFLSPQLMQRPYVFLNNLSYCIFSKWFFIELENFLYERLQLLGMQLGTLDYYKSIPIHFYQERTSES